MNKPSLFNDINNVSNIGKYHLILSENGYVLSYQFFKDYNETLKMPKCSILWFIDKKNTWKASINPQTYFGDDSKQNFLFDLEKNYPECAEWLLFNMEWLA